MQTPRPFPRTPHFMSGVGPRESCLQSPPPFVTGVGDRGLASELVITRQTLLHLALPTALSGMRWLLRGFPLCWVQEQTV